MDTPIEVRGRIETAVVPRQLERSYVGRNYDARVNYSYAVPAGHEARQIERLGRELVRAGANENEVRNALCWSWIELRNFFWSLAEEHSMDPVLEPVSAERAHDCIFLARSVNGSLFAIVPAEDGKVIIYYERIALRHLRGYAEPSRQKARVCLLSAWIGKLKKLATDRWVSSPLEEIFMMPAGKHIPEGEDLEDFFKQLKRKDVYV